MTEYFEQFIMPSRGHYHAEVWLAGNNGKRVIGTHLPSGDTIADTRHFDVFGDSPEWRGNLPPNSEISPAGTKWARDLTGVGVDPSDEPIYFEVIVSASAQDVSLHLTDVPTAVPSGAVEGHNINKGAHADLIRLSRLESIGAQIDQTTARTLEARWLQFIRDAGSASPPHATWHYLGGDVTDAVYVPGSTDVFWIFADGFDAGPSAINASTDLYTTTPLPQRSGAIVEATPGTFTGATQLFASGTSGLWLNAATQGGFAGHHWWPIGIIDDNGTYRVACWRVLDGDSPHGNLIENDIVTLVFGVYQSHISTGLGALTDDFWISGMWRDTTHTYIYAMEFVPTFDARTAANPTAANYVLENPRDHYSLTRLARVPNGQLLTPANYTYWNGSAWVSGVTNAQPLVDIDGKEIQGDAGLKKINNTHYLLAAHKLMDSHLDVYKAAAPQGPWTQISRVPLQTQGHSVNGPNTYQVGQLCKFVPSQAQATPAEHSMVIISRNTIVPTVGYSAEEPFTSRNIRRYCPQFAVVNHI